jgi:hypothetical protein
MSLVAALWAFANYMDDTIISSVWLQTSYALGALVISMGLVWTLFITKSKVSKSKYLLLAIVTLLFCIGSYLQNFIFISYNKSAAGSIAFGEPGWGLIPYGIYYLVTAFLIIWKLHKAKITASNEEQRKQFQNIQHGASITLLVTCLSSFILPFFSILPFGGTDNVGFLIFLLFVAYSITKHRLFNIRVIAIEVVIFILWVTLVFQIFTAKTHEDLAIRIAILATSIIFGILLIRSTNGAKNSIRATNTATAISTPWWLMLHLHAEDAAHAAQRVNVAEKVEVVDANGRDHHGRVARP